MRRHVEYFIEISYFFFAVADASVLTLYTGFLYLIFWFLYKICAIQDVYFKQKLKKIIMFF